MAYCFCYTEFVDLFNLIYLCKQDNFEQAYAIIKTFEPYNCPQKDLLEKRYLSFFHEKYDENGIDKRFLADPYLKKISDLLPSKIPSNYNQNLQEREIIKNRLLSDLKIKDPTNQSLKCIYNLIDIYHNNDHDFADIRQQIIYFIDQTTSDIKRNSGWQNERFLVQKVVDEYHRLFDDDESAEIYLTHGLKYEPLLFALDNTKHQSCMVDMPESNTIINEKLNEILSLLPNETICPTSSHSYVLSDSLLQNCKINNINADEYLYFTGTQIQHVLHKFDLQNLEMASDHQFNNLTADLQKLFDRRLRLIGWSIRL